MFAQNNENWKNEIEMTSQVNIEKRQGTFSVARFFVPQSMVGSFQLIQRIVNGRSLQHASKGKEKRDKVDFGNQG